jgi:hypothetical protein
MRKVLWILGACLSMSAWTVHAEVLTLTCSNREGTESATYDFDLEGGTVRHMSGNPPRLARAEVSDRLITWNNPYIPEWKHRLDRANGMLDLYVPERGWGNEIRTCTRSKGDVFKN